MFFLGCLPKPPPRRRSTHPTPTRPAKAMAAPTFFFMHKVVSTDGNVIWVKVSEKLTKEEYADLTASWEKMIATHGKMRLVFDMEDFHGWEPVAAWDDLKFSLGHAAQIERVAMIGDKKWEEWASKLGSLLVKGSVRFFDSSQREEAQRWVRE